MASLYVTEYARVGMQAGSSTPIPAEPKVASQKDTYTTATTVTLNSDTKFVRLLADADFHLETDGTAATASEPLYKSNTEYFIETEGIAGIGAAGTFSVYDGTS